MPAWFTKAWDPLASEFTMHDNILLYLTSLEIFSHHSADQNKHCKTPILMVLGSSFTHCDDLDDRNLWSTSMSYKIVPAVLRLWCQRQTIHRASQPWPCHTLLQLIIWESHNAPLPSYKLSRRNAPPSNHLSDYYLLPQPPPILLNPHKLPINLTHLLTDLTEAYKASSNLIASPTAGEWTWLPTNSQKPCRLHPRWTLWI